MKTSKLTGVALDWAVTKCETGQPLDRNTPFLVAFKYSTDWTQGGPIIEREGMGVWMYQWNEQGEPEVGWYAETKNGDHVNTGFTPLEAAMRCFVASKLGDKVEIPIELK